MTQTSTDRHFDDMLAVARTAHCWSADRLPPPLLREVPTGRIGTVTGYEVCDQPAEFGPGLVVELLFDTPDPGGAELAQTRDRVWFTDLARLPHRSHLTFPFSRR